MAVEERNEPVMLIVADDLSGATDCGAACVSRGLETVVALGAWRDMNADVLAVDADTRHMSPERAAEVTGKIVREQTRPTQLLYKKLDSTLRGNVGAELAAALQAFRSLEMRREERQGFVVVAPALPQHGRTTYQGHQMLGGTPLGQTEIWRHEGMSGSAYIPRLLRGAGLRTELIPLDVVRFGGDHLRIRMVELGMKADAVVCDATEDGDLQNIAAASSSIRPRVMWAGSAGLAYHLPAAVGFKARAGVENSRQPIATGPTLFVIGSFSSVSRDQIAALLLEKDVRHVRVPVPVLHGGNQSLDWGLQRQKLRAAMESGSDVVVQLGGEVEADMTQGRLLCSALAQFVAEGIKMIGGLVLSGGETACEVLKILGVTGLRLVEELEPGIPLSLTLGLDRNLPVITKAGGFGNPQSLIHCGLFLRRLDRNGTPVAASQES